MTNIETQRKELDLRSGCLGMVAMVVVTALVGFGALFAQGFDFDDSGGVGTVMILCGLVGAIAFFRFGRKRRLSLSDVHSGKTMS